jgi:hypothetical protein
MNETLNTELLPTLDFPLEWMNPNIKNRWLIGTQRFTNVIYNSDKSTSIAPSAFFSENFHKRMINRCTPMFLHVPLPQVGYFHHLENPSLDYWIYTISARFHRRSPMVVVVPVKPVTGKPLGEEWEVLTHRLTDKELHNLKRILGTKKYAGILKKEGE